MDINDALNMIRRLENLPEIYDQIERAVCGVVHSYFQDMLEVERLEAEIMSSSDYNRDELEPHLEKKAEIHKKYWSNSSPFYQPCSSSSSPEHIWECLSDIEILQNGDDDCSLYIFKANLKDPDHGLVSKKAFILKLKEGHLYIGHELFG
ncbi:hypothetical protein [Grimontia sp. NTOU-MAR1]|uniref:hypothetical protein n=1 Tax=Grimontia sp. NTOU-MAR1 TaxID=3111011 RepID=UPI002DC051AB|nr:hypothetical protein [Grimontia sp. NTOU-MAR1]WRV97964.1 hypothetical protein VP504_00550 [Grimontia sp. NTOU-MAR1]